MTTTLMLFFVLLTLCWCTSHFPVITINFPFAIYIAAKASAAAAPPKAHRGLPVIRAIPAVLTAELPEPEEAAELDAPEVLVPEALVDVAVVIPDA